MYCDDRQTFDHHFFKATCTNIISKIQFGLCVMGHLTVHTHTRTFNCCYRSNWLFQLNLVKPISNHKWTESKSNERDVHICKKNSWILGFTSIHQRTAYYTSIIEKNQSYLCTWEIKVFGWISMTPRQREYSCINSLDALTQKK